MLCHMHCTERATVVSGFPARVLCGGDERKFEISDAPVAVVYSEGVRLKISDIFCADERR